MSGLSLVPCLNCHGFLPSRRLVERKHPGCWGEGSQATSTDWRYCDANLCCQRNFLSINDECMSQTNFLSLSPCPFTGLPSWNIHRPGEEFAHRNQCVLWLGGSSIKHREKQYRKCELSGTVCLSLSVVMCVCESTSELVCEREKVLSIQVIISCLSFAYFRI